MPHRGDVDDEEEGRKSRGPWAEGRRGGGEEMNEEGRRSRDLSISRGTRELFKLHRADRPRLSLISPIYLPPCLATTHPPPNPIAVVLTDSFLRVLDAGPICSSSAILIAHRADRPPSNPICFRSFRTYTPCIRVARS